MNKSHREDKFIVHLHRLTFSGPRPQASSIMLSELLVETLRPYHFRGKLRLLRALTPSQGERLAGVFGTRMHLDLGEDIQRHIYLGAFEPRETALVRHWLHPGMTFVDVGANAGYYTALAAHC